MSVHRVLPLIQLIALGLTGFSTPAHIARATLEAASYQTRAVLNVIEEDCNVKLESLNVDGEFLMGELNVLTS